MKKDSTEAERVQRRHLVFEALKEAPTGVPDIQKLIPEFFPSGKIRSADKKRVEDAVAIIKETESLADSLTGRIKSAVPADLLAQLDPLAQRILHVALYETLELRAEPDEVFKTYLELYKPNVPKQKQNLEKALFSTIFASGQFLLWQLLQQSMPDFEPKSDLAQKLSSSLGNNAVTPPPKFVDMALSGIAAHKDLLDAALERFFRKKQWTSLPESCRDILRIGLFEFLIGLASPEAIASSLHFLLSSVMRLEKSENDYARTETEKFIRASLEKSARSLGRALAFQTIYSLAFSDIGTEAELRGAYLISPYNISSVNTMDIASVYSWQLLLGVWQNVERLDEIVNRYSHKWRTERMGKIEITLLRLALYEMIFLRVPARIVISEIMDIADMFGASEAKNLVNGILDAVSKSGEFQLMNREGNHASH